MMDNVGSSHSIKQKEKKRKKKKKEEDKRRQSLLRAFVAHRGWSLVKKSKKTKDQPITQRKKRGRKEVKKDKTNRARRRVKAKRSDVDLEFLTREFHPRIVPVEEERVQSDIKKGQFSFLPWTL